MWNLALYKQKVNAPFNCKELHKDDENNVIIVTQILNEIKFDTPTVNCVLTVKQILNEVRGEIHTVKRNYSMN